MILNKKALSEDHQKTRLKQFNQMECSFLYLFSKKIIHKDSYNLHFNLSCKKLQIKFTFNG